MKDMMTINIQKSEEGMLVLVGTNAKDHYDEVEILECIEDWLWTEKVRVYNEIIKADNKVEDFRKNNWEVKR